ncbi:toMV susceptible protein tm-2-like [Magnolia sinica]|uniref:toMV susceptible protein tm-2-like n=1 Tax=Magnolia sinica TaxID=86752 RepID=UPI0026594F48|nr:toMV susceptible protein tm-2-like [Magnolia sinica]
MDTTSEEVLGRKFYEYLEGKRYLKALPGNLAPSCPLNLEELGRKIVVKCGGLPLAIVVLGGGYYSVLSRKEKSVNEWDKVLKRVEWWLHESKEDGILGILALSYHDLPYSLKPCFLYFGTFPEDFEIPVAKLIKMWITEGFVRRIGEEEVEDVAEDYLNELIGRSLIQVAERKSNGTAKTGCIHDLLHDLLIAKAKEEIFLEVYRNIASTSPMKARRLAISSGDISKSSSLNCSVPHLRSLLHFSRDREMHFSIDREMLEKPQLKILVGAFKFLRVMHLQIHGICNLPDEIGYLIHLRYLCLKVRWLKSLPSTITRLSNLQTLNLRHTNVNKLPDDVWKMKQLRHLRLSKTSEKCKISESMQLHRLSYLQTLEVVEAGSWIEEGLDRRPI